jgi:DNA modification methylase
MHAVLDEVWEDVDRVLIPGGIVCVNIGDAVRSFDGVFRMFSNHSRIITKFLSLGFQLLPEILWRKPTNAPNKYMGSGMYPPNAYVTQEHEFILVFRKGEGRQFTRAQLSNRHQSAYFWEERNEWFSDLWTIPGTSQKLNAACSRSRSGAFPLEIAYRLVNMFSVKGDLVYDPFCGTGTVAKACMASERASVGVDIDAELCDAALQELAISQQTLNEYLRTRVWKHQEFVERVPIPEMKYRNAFYGFPVKTRQETELLIRMLESVERNGSRVVCSYTGGKSAIAAVSAV